MSITQETVNAAKRMRQGIRRMTDEQMVELVGAWVGAWDSIKEDFEEALAELDDLAGKTITRAQMARNQRLASALIQAEEVLTELFDLTQSVVARDLLTVLQDTAEGQLALMNSQLPSVTPGYAEVSVTLNAPAPDALNAIVKRTTETVHSQTRPLAPWVAAKMKEELVRGIVLGDNPRTTARLILKGAEDQFNGGLSRALNIARTEMLDAHRQGARVSDAANVEVLTGWLWMCTLDTRTCPSCLSNHGREFPIEEFGPIDHQMGRCARVPKTKSWKELGFQIEEPESKFPDSREWYDNLTEDSQKALMGPTRQRLLQEGKISWEDLSQLRKSSNWRDSLGVTPVKDLLAKAGDD